MTKVRPWRGEAGDILSLRGIGRGIHTSCNLGTGSLVDDVLRAAEIDVAASEIRY
jgi:hypothetical protein